MISKNLLLSMRRRRTASDIAAFIAQLPSDDSGSDIASSDSDEVGDISDSDSSQTSDSEVETQEHSRPPTADTTAARDGTVWYKMTSTIRGRCAAHNVFKANPGPKAPCVETPYDAWKLIINERMLRLICECTNDYAESIGIELHMDLDELEAFIALQYVRGIIL